MLSRPVPADIRRRLQKFKRRRVAEPAGVPLTGTGGEDVAEREYARLTRSLHVPASKQVLRSIVTASTNASGDILQAYSCTDPSHSDGADPFGAATNWASLIAIYDQYKPVEAILEWFPFLPNNPSGTNATAPSVVGFDVDSTPTAGTPTSEDFVLQYESARTFDVFRRFRYRIKIPKRRGAAQLGWMDVAQPASEPAIIMHANTLLAASTAYGRMVLTIVAWFKSSR